jgi:hypothetical protein
MSIGATGSLRVFTPEFRSSIGHELIRLADGLVGRLGLHADATEASA